MSDWILMMSNLLHWYCTCVSWWGISVSISLCTSFSCMLKKHGFPFSVCTILRCQRRLRTRSILRSMWWNFMLNKGAYSQPSVAAWSVFSWEKNINIILHFIISYYKCSAFTDITAPDQPAHSGQELFSYRQESLASLHRAQGSFWPDSMNAQASQEQCWPLMA